MILCYKNCTPQIDAIRVMDEANYEPDMQFQIDQVIFLL